MKHFHFIGIGGVGMSALARILLDQKIVVSGSDQRLSLNTKRLSEQGAHICEGHGAQNIPEGATVVYSSGIKEGNPELERARAGKFPLLHRSELLARLMEGHKTLCVAGTHGKTTTTALLTSVLLSAGYDPTYAIGGMLGEHNGKLGKGAYFVAEGDESDGTLLNYHPYGAIVTNLEPEHMDHYGSEEKLVAAFDTFFSQVASKEHLIYCGDAFKNKPGIAYGFGEHNEARLHNSLQEGWNTYFDLTFRGATYERIEVPLPGSHNALNAAAVFVMALQLGLDEAKVRRGLATFPGVARRCEKKREEGGVLFLDDYAHHPTEVKATLEGVKKAVGERRLVAIFQPHRYSRTHHHLEEFATAFEAADHLFVTEIYAAGETPIDGIDAAALINRVAEKGSVPVSHVDEIRTFLRPHDVVITLGAGNITSDGLKPCPLTVGLLYGGRSLEHDISLKSAHFVDENLDRTLYTVERIKLEREGAWPTPEILERLQKCDVILPIFHGPYGEDGRVQGLLEMLDIPYVGPDFRAAAVCMDKDLTKTVVKAAGLPTKPWVALYRGQTYEGGLRFPVYVKPAHLGSSLGITRVEKTEELVAALEKAWAHDTKAIVEEAVMNAREFEFAAMGNSPGPIDVPPPGEKLADGAFVDYEKKYSKNPVQTTVTPILSDELVEKGQRLARQAYLAVGCDGLTRVDFLLDDADNFWFNEMNPIPGLQPFSLFPKIWNHAGLSNDALVNRLIVLALARCRKHAKV